MVVVEGILLDLKGSIQTGGEREGRRERERTELALFPFPAAAAAAGRSTGLKKGGSFVCVCVCAADGTGDWKILQDKKGAGMCFVYRNSLVPDLTHTHAAVLKEKRKSLKPPPLHSLFHCKEGKSCCCFREPSSAAGRFCQAQKSVPIPPRTAGHYLLHLNLFLGSHVSPLASSSFCQFLRVMFLSLFVSLFRAMSLCQERRKQREGKNKEGNGWKKISVRRTRMC